MVPPKVITGGRRRPAEQSLRRDAAGRRLAPAAADRHACRVSQRTLMLIGLSLLIAALTLFVSRKFGFTFIFLPLFFAWGGGRRGGS
jgi:hypothetical protein